MKRVIALILVLLLLGGGVLFYRHARYARVNDELYSLSDTTELDLEGSLRLLLELARTHLNLTGGEAHE